MVEPAVPPIVEPVPPGGVEPIVSVDEPVVPIVSVEVPIEPIVPVPDVVEPVEPDVLLPEWRPPCFPRVDVVLDDDVLGDVVDGFIEPLALVPLWPVVDPPMVPVEPVDDPLVCAIAAAGMIRAARPKVLIRRIVSLLNYRAETSSVRKVFPRLTALGAMK